MHNALIHAMRKHFGDYGKPNLIPFSSLLTAFAPDLYRTNYLDTVFTKEELENIEPFIEKTLKAFTKNARKSAEEEYEIKKI